MDFLTPIEGWERFVLLLVTVVTVTSAGVPIACVGFCQWRKVREREAAAALIHDMVSRGLPTDEIERVLTGAGFSKSARDAHGRRC